MKTKILVKGPALTQSGYGEHCRFVLRALRSREDILDIYLLNIPWGRTNWLFEDNEERRWIDSLINKTVPYIQSGNAYFDMSVQVTIANELEKIAPKNFLVTAGIESDRVSPQWLQKCHELADKIIVVSEHSKNSFLNTKVKVVGPDGSPMDYTLSRPIEIAGYPVKKFKKVDLKLKLEHDFNFLCVSQWGPRKNFENTVRWFMEEFRDKEVGLVIKTYMAGNSIMDKIKVKNSLKEVLDEYKAAKCSVNLIHGYMSNDEIHSLYSHKKIKALINFTHGEGFGLPMFEAAYCGLPVISHDWGGQTDFLYAPKKDKKGKTKNRAFFVKVPYKLEPVNKEAVWDGVLQADSNWAYVSASGAKVAMRDVYNNYGVYSGRAKKLQKHVLENFSEEKQNENLLKCLEIFDLNTEQEIDKLFNELSL